MTAAQTIHSRPARRQAVVQVVARLGVALSAAAVVVQLVFAVLATDLVIRQNQPADSIVFHLGMVAAPAVLAAVVRGSARRMIAKADQ